MDSLASPGMPHWLQITVLVSIALAAIVSIVASGKKLRIWNLVEAISHQLSTNGGGTARDKIDSAALDSRIAIAKIEEIKTLLNRGMEKADKAVGIAQRAVERAEAAVKHGLKAQEAAEAAAAQLKVQGDAIAELRNEVHEVRVLAVRFGGSSSE